MILITITNAKEKLIMVLKLMIIIVLLGLIVPKLYTVLSEAGSLHRWSEKEVLPHEPMRVEETKNSSVSSFWSNFIDNIK